MTNFVPTHRSKLGLIEEVKRIETIQSSTSADTYVTVIEFPDGSRLYLEADKFNEHYEPIEPTLAQHQEVINFLKDRLAEQENKIRNVLEILEGISDAVTHIIKEVKK